VYPHQAERLDAALQASGAAALVATAPENVRYIAGVVAALHPRDPRRPFLAVFARGGTALILPAEAVLEAATETPDVTAVVCYGEGDVAGDAGREDTHRARTWLAHATATPEDALEAALAGVGAAGERIALDEDGLSPGQWRGLAARLGATRVGADGARHLATARAVKAPFEIECLDRALAFAEDAVNEAIQMVKPGVTEREAAQLCTERLLARDVVPGPLHVATGPDSAVASRAPTARALRAGDLVRFVVRGAHKGYHAEVARTAVVGEPSPRQAEALQAGIEAAIDALRPGAAAGAVASAAHEAVRAGGLARARSAIGRGIGLAPWEWPDLAPGGDVVVEPGMVLVVALSYEELGWGGIGLTDTVLVTRTGGHSLNRSRRGLVVLD
jgi:Xaa-Pro aminopeptidase